MHTKTSLGLRVLLTLSGAIAAGIGTTLLFAPSSLYGSNGIDLGSDVNLLNEVRAPGGMLLIAGFAMLAGAFARRLARPATAIGATVFLAYGGSRLIAMALDGIPAPGLVGATVIELVLGSLCTLALVRAIRCAGPCTRRS